VCSNGIVSAAMLAAKLSLQWKGSATYHNLTPPGSTKSIQNRVWSYESPTSRFKPLKDYLSFYASVGGEREAQVYGGEWRCFVDGERVGVQEGQDFSCSASIK